MSENDWCPNGLHEGSCNCIPEAPVRAMAAWISGQQLALWSDLDDAIRNAINGIWSIAAGHATRAIISAATLIGAAPYDSVPWTLLAGGIYDAVLTGGNIPHEMPDAEEWARLDELMTQHGGPRTLLSSRFFPTVEAIAHELSEAQ